MNPVRFALLPLVLAHAPVPLAAAASASGAAASPAQPETAKTPPSAEITSLRDKAERGNAIAQYNLGLAYAQGGQLPVDLPEAFVWLSLAAESGSTGRALEALLGSMTPSDMAEGRRRLEKQRQASVYLRPAANAPATPPAAAAKAPAPLPAPTKSAGSLLSLRKAAAPAPTPVAAPLASSPIAAPAPPSPQVESTTRGQRSEATVPPAEAKPLDQALANWPEEKRRLTVELAAARKEAERLQAEAGARG